MLTKKMGSEPCQFFQINGVVQEVYCKRKNKYNNQSSVIVNVIDQQSSLQINSQQIQKITEEVIANEGQSCDEVTIFFVGVEKICELHEQFFQDPSPTDCISFPLDEEESSPYRVLGDIFICPATAVDYAAQHKVNVEEETILYLVHGLLHLMGYDDREEKDQKLMFDAQDRHMQHLKKISLCFL